MIPAGASLRVIADSLAAHHVIGSKRWFLLVARVGRFDRRVQSGPYQFVHGVGARAALRDMVSGRAILTRFTVPEGYTILDIAEVAQHDLGIPADQFLTAARDSALLREFEIPSPSFEGFLWPETYLFAVGVSASTVVRAMAELFRSSWRAEWNQRAVAQGLSRLAVVIIASLVEGEAKLDEDRPLVAAVYRNRLRLGIPLQADPTVQYALQLATGARKSRLFEKDYAFPSPYNTYLNQGMPPGPVGAPSRKSIEAALAPAAVPYLYFVAGPDGRHIFSKTYREHLRAVRRVQRGK